MRLAARNDLRCRHWQPCRNYLCLC
eukprot:COSAG01_NODE_73765_length_237_cov_3.405797_1_plen_24_part_10